MVKIQTVKALPLGGVQVIKFARFRDHRRYSAEHYRQNALKRQAEVFALGDAAIVQGNASFSKAGTIGGLHFQWNPYMGKLVRRRLAHAANGLAQRCLKDPLLRFPSVRRERRKATGLS